MTIQYEYKVYALSEMGGGLLNKMGLDGWKLSVAQGGKLIFRRKITSNIDLAHILKQCFPNSRISKVFSDFSVYLESSQKTKLQIKGWYLSRQGFITESPESFPVVHGSDPLQDIVKIKDALYNWYGKALSLNVEKPVFIRPLYIFYRELEDGSGWYITPVLKDKYQRIFVGKEAVELKDTEELLVNFVREDHANFPSAADCERAKKTIRLWEEHKKESETFLLWGAEGL